MIQPILFFALGFLSAGFIALLIAPAALRRASSLARRRMEASMPLTPAEIQADKDHVRAEAAMSIRRLEMNVSSLRDKTSTQLVEISRALEHIKALAMDGDVKAKMIASLEAQVGTLGADLARSEEELLRVSARLLEAESAKTAKADENEKLGAMYDEASFTASSRQIELVARESELEKLANDIQQLKAKRKDADTRAQAAALEIRAARDELKTERKRATELEKKTAQLTSKLADREELLAQRGTALDRLRGAPIPGKEQKPASRSVSEQAEIDQALAKLSADRERLEERMTLLARENKRLKDLSAGSSSSLNKGDARLREQMSEMAAEVVNLVAKLDGPDSPISKALADTEAAGDDGAAKKLSLADRVRALQKAPSGG